MAGQLQYLTPDLTKTLFQLQFKDLNIFKMTPGGSSAAHYALSPPLNNAVFGPHILMVPVPAPPPAGPTPPAMGMTTVQPLPAGSAPLAMGPASLHAVPAGLDWKQSSVQLAQKPGVLVLVERSVPNQDVVVVPRGFAQLAAALQRSGGGLVKFP